MASLDPARIAAKICTVQIFRVADNPGSTRVIAGWLQLIPAPLQLILA